MRLWLAVAALAVACGALSAGSAHAEVPPPPPPPNCPSCNPPPPPPTPVPTVGPVAVPATPVVEVRITADKVSRGQTEKVSVDASTNDNVTLVVQYKSGKPITYHSRIGGSGSLTKAFKIPKTAPVGKAAIKVSVKGSTSYSKTITFVVTK